MNNDFFRLEIEKGIATIWIDSKNDKMNIVSPSLIGDFEEVFNEVNQNDQIQGAILISAKKDFIAGADIKSFKGEKVGDFQPTSRKGHAMLQAIQDCRKPIVAAIHGTCYGWELKFHWLVMLEFALMTPKRKWRYPKLN